jgi:hypothetical protein
MLVAAATKMAACIVAHRKRLLGAGRAQKWRDSNRDSSQKSEPTIRCYNVSTGGNSRISSGYDSISGGHSRITAATMSAPAATVASVAATTALVAAIVASRRWFVGSCS